LSIRWCRLLYPPQNCQQILYERRPGRAAQPLPCSPGKYRENIDFAPFKDRAGAVKLLMFRQTVRQIP
jgi:hypothetical protein